MNVDDDDFDEGEWRKLVSSRHDRYVEEDMDRDGKPIPMSRLHNEWLTDREVQHRNVEQKRQWFSGKEQSKEHLKNCFNELEKDPTKENTKSLQDFPRMLEDNTPNLESASDSGDELSLVDEGEILPEADITQDDPTAIQRSTRVKVPIKWLMDKQTLF